MNKLKHFKEEYFTKRVKNILIVLFGLVVSISAAVFIRHEALKEQDISERMFIEETSYNESHKHIYKLNMEYNIKKNILINEIDSFIYKNAPNSNLYGGYIIDECIRGEYFDVILLLSQGLKESHFGTFGLANRTNSVFNVGAYDNKTFNEINKSFKFSDPNNSIRPYIKLMNNRYLSNKLSTDLLQKFVDVNGKRYASYEHYERDLSIIYTDICKRTSIQTRYSELVMIHKKLSNIY